MSRRPVRKPSSRSRAARVGEIHRRLARAHGPLSPSRRWEPLEELVLTILSQNTSDLNSGRAYESLRERFASWEALASARPSQVEAAIRIGGLAKVKAPRILAVLREIREREGKIDLGWMRRAPDREIEEYLSSLPGVGPKTVACVLAFSLGRPALPVDTHVHRVATRLGLLPPGMPATRAHQVLAELVPPRQRVSMHVGLIRHGREICKSGRPRCEECPLADLCPTAPVILGEAVGSGSARKRGASVAWSG